MLCEYMHYTRIQPIFRSVLQFFLFSANFISFVEPNKESIPLDLVEKLDWCITFYFLLHLLLYLSKQQTNELLTESFQVFSSSEQTVLGEDQYKLLSDFSRFYRESGDEANSVVEHFLGGLEPQKRDSGLAFIVMLLLEIDNTRFNEAVSFWWKIDDLKQKTRCFRAAVEWSMNNKSVECLGAFLKHCYDDSTFMVLALDVLDSFLNEKADLSECTFMMCQTALDLCAKCHLFRQAAVDAWRFYVLLVAEPHQSYMTVLRRGGFLSRCCSFLMQCESSFQWFVTPCVGCCDDVVRSIAPPSSIFGKPGRVVTLNEVQTLTCVERGRITLFSRSNDPSQTKAILSADDETILKMLLNSNFLQSAFLLCVAKTDESWWNLFCGACGNCLAKPSTDIELPDDIDSLEAAVKLYTDKFSGYVPDAAAVMLEACRHIVGESHTVVLWLKERVKQ